MGQFKHRIVLVEDNEKVREGIEFIVNHSDKYRIINSYDNCEQAIKRVKKDDPEIMLMDLELTGMDGLEGTKIVKSKFPDIHILVLTVYDDEDMIEKALRLGVSGYITKDSNYNEIIRALDEVIEGRSPLSGDVAKKIISSYRINNNTPLSRRETEVIKLMARGLTYTQIASRLNISPETVKTHFKNIYTKLGVSGKSQAISLALNNRYI